MSPHGLPDFQGEIVGSQVFCTDLLPPPPLLLTNDDVTASDHLRVVMLFNYPDPPLRATLTVSNQTVVLRWPSLVGRNYTIETSTNLGNWFIAVSNHLALAGQQTWTAPAAAGAQFYRVAREP